jgi:Undecaprenyl-phosphate galactose phosphotransferase WbaP
MLKKYPKRRTVELHPVKNRFDFRPEIQKRSLDVIVSFFGLLLLSPLLGLIFLLIKLDDHGRVFFCQQRLGQGGKLFEMYKFRTMNLCADKILIDKMKIEPKLQAEWDNYQKLQNDPRITRVGRFLRRFSLDELPQLWNVLKGEMSLVGPRPILANQRDLYGSWFTDYILVKPGITGLWQVSGRSDITFVKRAEFDKEYIKCWSVWLDIQLLIKTIRVVLWHHGAY